MFALVDCNNFYASCERVFNPKVKNKPVVVLSNNDGCIIARSAEAKKLGIEMGGPAFKIEPLLQKHGVAVFSSNYALYGDLSERVMTTLAEFAPAIEVYSIDEAFLGLHGMRLDAIPDYAAEVRQRVVQWTGIPVSLGIAHTKTLAKAANRIAKKKFSDKGICFLDNETAVSAALSDFDISDIWGIGRRYSVFLKAKGVKTALQLRNIDDSWIQRHLSIVGLKMVHELRGIPCYTLEERPPAKQNICNARSFGHAQGEFEPISEAVATFAAACAAKLRKQTSSANIVSVFLETNRFKEDEAQYFPYKTLTFPEATNATNEIIKMALDGLKMIYRKNYRYKKAGVMVGGIVPASEVQMDLFSKTDHSKQKALMEAMDKVNAVLGRDKVRIASQGFDREWRLRQERLSPCYTTRWDDLLTIRL
ncbi:MAG: Y-family DNA polymerase [Fibrobacteres bacterium]|nr:Y-family DNA polymerase [Fibrobacterota bacterium]